MAIIGFKQPHHAFHQYGFTAPACSDDQVALPCFHDSADILYYRFVAKSFQNIFYFNHKGSCELLAMIRRGGQSLNLYNSNADKI